MLYLFDYTALVHPVQCTPLLRCSVQCKTSDAWKASQYHLYYTQLLLYTPLINVYSINITWSSVNLDLTLCWQILTTLDPRYECTAIPYRVSTGPEQGFPCVVFPHREKPVFSSWDPCNENRIFPVGNTTQGKPCFHYRNGFAVQLKLRHSEKVTKF